MPASSPFIYEVFDHQKTDLLIALLKQFSATESIVVFLKSRESVHTLTSELNKAGISVDSVHGSKKPELRERTVKEFLARKFQVLVTTESVVRDTDLANVRTIIYFEFHERDADYLRHLETAEKLVNFITQDEHNLLLKLDKLAGGEVPRERLEGFPYAAKPKKKKARAAATRRNPSPSSTKSPNSKTRALVAKPVAPESGERAGNPFP